MSTRGGISCRSGEEVRWPGEDSTRSSLALSPKEANRSSHPSAPGVKEVPVARVLRRRPMSNRRPWRGSRPAMCVEKPGVGQGRRKSSAMGGGSSAREGFHQIESRLVAEGGQ
jgi:hypothetical protein